MIDFKYVTFCFSIKNFDLPSQIKCNMTQKQLHFFIRFILNFCLHLDLECRSIEVDAQTNICVVVVSVHAVCQYKGN